MNESLTFLCFSNSARLSKIGSHAKYIFLWEDLWRFFGSDKNTLFSPAIRQKQERRMKRKICADIYYTNIDLHSVTNPMIPKTFRKQQQINHLRINCRHNLCCFCVNDLFFLLVVYRCSYTLQKFWGIWCVKYVCMLSISSRAFTAFDCWNWLSPNRFTFHANQACSEYLCLLDRTCQLNDSTALIYMNCKLNIRWLEAREREWMRWET